MRSLTGATERKATGTRKWSEHYLRHASPCSPWGPAAPRRAIRSPSWCSGTRRRGRPRERRKSKHDLRHALPVRVGVQQRLGEQHGALVLVQPDLVEEEAAYMIRTGWTVTSHKSSQHAGVGDERLTAARATLSENGETLQRVLRHALPVRLGVQLRLGGQQDALPGALESVDGEAAGTKQVWRSSASR